MEKMVTSKQVYYNWIIDIMAFIISILFFIIPYNSNQNIPIDELIMKADNYTSECKFKDAFKIYSKALVREPNNSDILRKIGICFIGIEYFNKTCKNLFIYYPAWSIEEIKRIKPPIQMINKNLRKAIFYCKRAVEEEKSDFDKVEGYLALGLAYYCISDFEGAKTYFEKATQLKVEVNRSDEAFIYSYLNGTSWMALGLIYEKLHYSKELIEECKNNAKINYK